MYKAITIIFLSIWSITLNAQLEQSKLYKIYLFNGEVFRGELLNDDEYDYGDDFIEMKLLDGTIVKLSTEDIMDYIKFQAPFPKISNYKMIDDLWNGTIYRATGPYVVFQLGLVPDRAINHDEKEFSIKPTITVINGYKFKRGYALGLGVNFDIFNKAFFPVFIDVRKYFRRRPVSMFISGNVGYGFAFNQFSGGNTEVQEGGTMLQGGGGFSIATKENVEMLFEISFRSQEYKRKRPSWSSLDYAVWEHWVFQVGFIF